MPVTEEKARVLAAGLFQQYAQLGDEARINKGLLAEYLGISRARWGQIQRSLRDGESVSVDTRTFLALSQGVQRLREGFNTGLFPLPAKKGKPQQDAGRFLFGDNAE